jgi:hypothetical protein
MLGAGHHEPLGQLASSLDRAELLVWSPGKRRRGQNLEPCNEQKAFCMNDFTRGDFHETQIRFRWTN